MTAEEAFEQVNRLCSHIWMVRTFLKHCDEAQEDDELMEVPRELYDYMLALGEPYQRRDVAAYLRLAHKKFAKLKRASEQYARLQPEISNHTNFEQARLSLETAVRELGQTLDAWRVSAAASP